MNNIVLMLQWYPSLLIQFLHVFIFKLQKNEICDMKGPKIEQKSNRNGLHVQ